MNTKIRLYVLHLFLFATLLCFASLDRNIRFTHLTNHNGLPTNSIYSINQDSKGFIWVGTKSGICKYDGKSIALYDIELPDGSRKIEHTIRQVFEDNQHRLWVVANKCINLYDRQHDRFNLIEVDSLTGSCRVLFQDNGKIYLGGAGSYVYNEEQNKFIPLRNKNNERIRAYITSIAVDNKGQLWMGKLAGGLVSINPNDGETTNYKRNSAKNSLVSNRITALYTDQNGNLWIGTEDKGLCYLDPTVNEFFTIKDFPAICVRCFAEDAQGNVWIGTENGLYIYSVEEKRFLNYKQNYNDKHSINDNAIYCLFKDKEKNMLVGTYFGGINTFLHSFSQFSYYDYGYTDQFLSGKAVRQIIGDMIGNLWIATEDGGLNYFDKQKKKFRHFHPSNNANSLSYHNVHSLLLDKNDNLWVGTYLGGLNKYDTQTGRFTLYNTENYPGLIIDNIFALIEDREGRIWIGTTFGLTVYYPEQNTFNRFEPEVIGTKGVDALLEDSDGDIWIGTRTDGLYRYRKDSEKLEHMPHHPDGKGLSDSYINYIFEDSSKDIWIATHEGGVCKYNKTTERFTVYTTRNGLPSNVIFSIIECESGNIWISTNNGLSCLDRETNTFTNYSVSEGLPNKQFNYNSAYKDEDGLLYFGTINGMIAFNPEELQTTKNIAKIEFTDLKILGKSVIPGNEGSPLTDNIGEASVIHLSNEQAKSFTLEFTVPTISHSTSTFFAIRFNTDKGWNFIGSQNQLNYANLPAGEYILNIKAAFNNKWNGNEPIKSIKIIIAPPFWLSGTAWFIYSCIVVIVLTGLYLFIKKRQQEKNLILSERMEKEKIQEINKLKLNFFTNISHELRTPLSMILIPLHSFLEKNVFSPEIQPKMRLIARSAQRMNNLVEELMLFSKIETKQEKIRVKKGNLLEFVSNICEGFRILADEKGIELLLEIEQTEQDVWFAPVKVEKIIYNLLSNAFKYTEKGKVTVKAFYENNESFRYLKLQVSDTGVGIAPDQIEKIFENYYQVNDFVKSVKTGFGIGLALTRELVTLHKGNIKINSEPDVGSTFSITLNVSAEAFASDEISPNDANTKFMEDYKFLPVQKDNTFANSASTVENKISDKQYKLLIVEDNTELLSTYQELFSDTYTVITAENGKEGYQAAKKHLPDIIISDVMMPEMNGYDLARKLKHRIETCHIPLILLTAKTGEEAQMIGYKNGADMFVEKPFHPALLKRQMSNLIATKENQKKLFATNKLDVYEIKADERDKKLIEDMERIIIDNMDNNEFSLNYLLREVGIGRTLLHVKLKNLVGLSATEYINNVRLKEAIKIMAGGKNVSEAAYATGFSTPNYFTRCFKKVYGISPNEYMAKLKQQDELRKRRV